MIKIEGEHNELILKNEVGDIVIIPANKRDWIKNKIKDKCYDCIDKYVNTLPLLNNYAQDGTVISDGSVLLNPVEIVDEKPEWKKLKDIHLNLYKKENDFEKTYKPNSYIKRFKPDRYKALQEQYNQKAERFANNKVAEWFINENPNFLSNVQSYNNRVKTINSIPSELLNVLKNSDYANKIELPFTKQLESAFLSIGNAASPIEFKPNYVTEEEQKSTTPLTPIFTAASIPYNATVGKIASDIEGGPSYPLTDALSGISPPIQKEGLPIVADPLNLVGLGIWNKLSEAKLFNKLEDFYKYLNTSKEEKKIKNLLKTIEEHRLSENKEEVKQAWEDLQSIIAKYERYIPSEFEEAYRKAIIKYRDLSISEKNLNRALALDKKYGTNYYKLIQEQYERGNSLDNIWMKKEDYLPSYAEIMEPGTMIGNPDDLLEAGKDFAGVITYTNPNISFFDLINDPNYYAKAKSRNYAVVKDNLTNDQLYHIVSHEDKHIKDIAANTIRYNATTDIEKAAHNVIAPNFSNDRRINTIKDYYKAYEEGMFYALDELPEEQRNLYAKTMGKNSTRTLYDYYTTPTEIESHVMTNMRDDMVNKGYLSDQWDELTLRKLNDYFSNLEEDEKSFNFYKNTIKDKNKFIDRFNEATYATIPFYIYLNSLQNNEQQNNNQ